MANTMSSGRYRILITEKLASMSLWSPIPWLSCLFGFLLALSTPSVVQPGEEPGGSAPKTSAETVAGVSQGEGGILPELDPLLLGLDDRPLRAIRQSMEKFVEAKEIAGAVSLVAYRGAIVHWEAVGFRSLEDRQPMTRDTLFAIASMTKPIVATGLMILVDRGEICLDEPIATYLPEFKKLKLPDGQPPKSPPTVRQLLTHTSGLHPDQQMHGNLAETVRYLASQPLRFEPGTQWAYGPGLTVAGRIIEVVSGKELEKFLQDEIFQPLGMVDTTFHPSPEQQKRLAKLYQKNRQTGDLVPAEHWLINLSPTAPANPSGGLFSTAKDLVRFHQAILDGGILGTQQILREELTLEMRRIQTEQLTTGFTPGNGWGLGVCIVHQPQGVTAMLSPGTFGHGGAFGTQGWIDPERKMIFILLIQRLGLPNADQSAFRETLQTLATASLR
jgi:CubicO group peptidase (beta-lactamase class C family)